MIPWNGLFGAHSLELYAGLTIIGEIGETYAIDYVTDLADPAESDWRCLEYLQVTASPYLWTDQSSPATGRRFYRAVAMDPPENMVFIPPGSFRMGSPENEVGRSEEDGPQTDVIIRRGFWMGKHEVTQGEYEAVMGNNPSQFKGNPNRPVEQVSWFNARDYCVKLTERERLAGRIAPNSLYRLPTEAEWEYACRAGTSTRFSYGDDPGLTDFVDHAWYGPNSDGQTHPVGQKLPNRWGLHDMHGNVSEWCQDWHAKALPGGRVIDPQGPATGSARAIRVGGSYRNHLIASFCRSSTRYAHDSPGTYGPGFRVVLAPVQP
jgi:formylglycine-generating enzyme required for sulfatase activity